MQIVSINFVPTWTLPHHPKQNAYYRLPNSWNFRRLEDIYHVFGRKSIQASEIFWSAFEVFLRLTYSETREGERLSPPHATHIAPVPSRKMVVFLPRRDGGCGGRGRGLATREILGNYGFIPDLKISTHLNERKCKPMIRTKNKQILKLTNRALKRLTLLKLRNFSSTSGLAERF